MAALVDIISLPSQVISLSWSQGFDRVFVATEALSVLSIPLENCSNHLTCNECVASQILCVGGAASRPSVHNPCTVRTVM